MTYNAPITKNVIARAAALHEKIMWNVGAYAFGLHIQLEPGKLKRFITIKWAAKNEMVKYTTNYLPLCKYICLLYYKNWYTKDNLNN